MKKLISFKIYAEKGFLKKPDINDGIYLTYNMLHKPAILGILGAIIGLKGYKKNGELPEYYQKLNKVPVGVKPLNDEKGNFQKTIISYNNTTGMASSEPGGNLIITEQTLVAPGYQIYVLLDMDDGNQLKIYHHIKNQHAEYLPYLVKNDYSLWWLKDEVQEYDYSIPNSMTSPFVISTIFNKDVSTVRDLQYDDTHEMDMFDVALSLIPDSFASFERLPTGFDEKLMQYSYANFAFTNYKLHTSFPMENIYCLNNSEYVQLN